MGKFKPKAYGEEFALNFDSRFGGIEATGTLSPVSGDRYDPM